MLIEFLVEEESAEAALSTLVPAIIGDKIPFKIRVFQGKKDLLSRLPERLRAYRRSLPPDTCIVVLLDADQQNCTELKERLGKMARDAGFTTRSSRMQRERFKVVNRLAIEELEAWYFGDIEALCKVYPKLPANLHKKKRYRNPDTIQGGTWETLEKILQRAGYYQNGMPKIEVARLVARYMKPDHNSSRSFQIFRDTLKEIAAWVE